MDGVTPTGSQAEAHTHGRMDPTSTIQSSKLLEHDLIYFVTGCESLGRYDPDPM